MVNKLSFIRKFSLYALLSVLVFNLAVPPVANAACDNTPAADGGLSCLQRQVYASGVYYYDTTEYAQCNTGSPVLTGSQNAEIIFNYFTQQGLTPPQAAGIMGNLQTESGLNPRRVQNTRTPQGDSDTMVIGTSVGYGLAQWTSQGRQQNLHDAAVAAGKSDSDLKVQLDFLWKELTTSYKGAYEALRATSDVREATSIIMIRFESPKDQSQSAQSARAALSLGFLNKFGSGGSTPTGVTSTTTSTCDTDNAVVGDYSLPVDKKWYDEHKEWFTKPHHLHADGSPDVASDIPVPTGTLVYSVTAGRVIKAPNEGGYGEGVTIDAGNGITFIYGHGSDGGAIPGAKQGDVVKAGQPIMHSASTGKSTGPHLHVTIDINGTDYCPQNLWVGIAEGQVPSLTQLPTTGCSGGSKI